MPLNDVHTYPMTRTVTVLDIYFLPLALLKLKIPSSMEVIDFRPARKAEFFLTTDMTIHQAQADCAPWQPRLILKLKAEAVRLVYESCSWAESIAASGGYVIFRGMTQITEAGPKPLTSVWNTDYKMDPYDTYFRLVS